MPVRGEEAVPIQYKWTVLTVTTIGVLMAGIDSRIVIIGLPEVAAANGPLDAETAIWITQSYVLGSTVALLLIGRVSDILGRVRIYVGGFAVFTLGSLLSSLAVVPVAGPMLVAFRGLQGLGAGMLFTNSAAIITDAWPEGELGMALGINQVAFRAGAMAGLTLSGLILAVLDWRALFYVNVPIGIFGTLWARRRLKEIAKLERRAPIDWPGFATFTVGITSLLLALTFAAYGLADQTLVLALVAITVASFAAFVRIELRTQHPLLDLRLLRIREFSGGVTAQLLNAIAFGAVLLLLSLYFQLVRGLNPLLAGLAIIPLELSSVILGPISGKLSDKYGHRPFTTGGLALTSTALFLLSTADRTTPDAVLVVYMILLGCGLGVFASPNMSSIMGSVPPERRGIASGFRATFFNVGLTVSLNLAILVTSAYAGYGLVTQILVEAPSSIPAYDQAIFAAGLQQAYFWMGVVNTIAIIPSILRGRRVRANDRSAASSPPAPLPEP